MSTRSYSEFQMAFGSEKENNNPEYLDFTSSISSLKNYSKMGLVKVELIPFIPGEKQSLNAFKLNLLFTSRKGSKEKLTSVALKFMLENRGNK